MQDKEESIEIKRMVSFSYIPEDKILNAHDIELIKNNLEKRYINTTDLNISFPDIKATNEVEDIEFKVTLCSSPSINKKAKEMKDWLSEDNTPIFFQDSIPLSTIETLISNRSNTQYQMTVLHLKSNKDIWKICNLTKGHICDCEFDTEEKAWDEIYTNMHK